LLIYGVFKFHQRFSLYLCASECVSLFNSPDISSVLLLYLRVLPNMPSVQGTLAVILPDEVNAKLTEVLPLMNHDIGQLVQDAEPIRAIFKQIQGQQEQQGQNSSMFPSSRDGLGLG
jgi:hypothetical protein